MIGDSDWGFLRDLADERASRHGAEEVYAELVTAARVSARRGVRPLGSVALPLDGDHDEAEWDMRPVVGWARDCDGGGA